MKIELRIACLALVLLLGCTANSAPSPVASATPSGSTPSNQSLRIVREISLGGAPELAALAFGDSSVWVAIRGQGSGAGTLLRFDDTTGSHLSSWQIGGDPVGVGVNGAFVWVAAGIGDPRSAAADANTVTQMSATDGRVIHRYSVNQPQAVSADGDLAWAVSGGVGSVPTRMLRLRNGQIAAIATELGLLASNPGFTGPGLAVCESGIYTVTNTSDDKLRVFHTLANGTTTQDWTVTGGGVASIACGPDAVYLTDRSPDHGGGVYRLALPQTTPEPVGPAGVSDLAIASSQLWTIDQSFVGGSPGQVSLFDAATLQVLSRLQLPSGDARLLVAGATGAWAVVGSQLVAVQATVAPT